MELNEIRENESPHSDTLAEQEARRKYLDGELGIKFSEHAYIIARFAMYIGGVILITLAVVWCIHLIIPDCRRWLTTQEIQGIERILFSGILISVAGKYFKKFGLLNDEKPR